MLTEIVQDKSLSQVMVTAPPAADLLSFIEWYRQPRIDGVARVRYLPHPSFTLCFPRPGKGAPVLLYPARSHWSDEGHSYTVRFRFGFLPALLGFQNEALKKPQQVDHLLDPSFLQAMEETA